MDSIIHYEEEINSTVLDEKTISIIGYGNQGRAQALNLRDETSLEIVIGNRDDEYREIAQEDDMEVVSIAEAVQRGDLISVLLPDEVAPDVFETDIEPYLTEGDTVNFAHGYNIYFDIITTPKDVNIVLVGPRMIGEAVRARYLSEEGFPSLVAVNRDQTGTALEIALALAKAIGSTKGGSGAIESSFEAETKTDLITELALFPALIQSIQIKYHLEKELGIPPTVSLTETYLSKEIGVIFETFAEEGLLPTLTKLSPTAQYAILSGIREFDQEPVVEFMSKQIELVEDASFVHEWYTDKQLNNPKLKKLYEGAWSTEMMVDERQTMEALGIKKEEAFESDYDDLIDWLRYS